MLDNMGQPCNSITGESGCVLLGSEQVNESILHSTSLLQGKCRAPIMLAIVGQPRDSVPMIRDVCYLAVNRESVLHSTSLLQGKCEALISLITWGNLLTP